MLRIRPISRATLSVLSLAAFRTDAAAARAVFDATGVRAGLCVHLGATDPSLTIELHNNQRVLVNALAPDGPRLPCPRVSLWAEGASG